MIETGRLLLRQWRDDDLAPLTAICQDPQVMRFYPATSTDDEVVAFVGRQRQALGAGRPGLYATELGSTGELIGYVGLAVPTYRTHFTPCVEIGWRLAAAHWGVGYAPEAARAVLEHGFRELGLDEIVSFTAVLNRPSQRVMEKIGMTRDPADDFEHPSVPLGHPIRPHVLYRMPRSRWVALRAGTGVTSDTRPGPPERG